MPLIAVRDAVREAILKGQEVDIRQPRRTDDPRWQIGKDYLLTAKKDARFVCVEIRTQFLHEADDEQAQREIFPNAWKLFEWWRDKHGEGCGHGMPGFPTRHVEIPTWIITVELDRSEHAEFMHQDSSHGYTRDPRLAIEKDAEVVPAVWREKFADDGRVYGELRRLKAKEEARGTLSLEDRLRRAQALSMAKGRDMSRHLRVIERRIQAIEDEAA